MDELKPCPFCGSTNIVFAEGSTFRWLAAGCGDCGAIGEETRVKTLGERDEEGDKKRAAEAWNRRAEQVPEVALYHELLFAVASKFPNESRHQTALRYINSAEHGQTKVGTMPAPEVKP